MESALIVSFAEKGAAFFQEMLTAASFCTIVTLRSCGEARRLILDRDFDLVIINAPLQDESGESLARHISLRSASQVILVVRSEYYEEVAAAIEDDGVLTVAKPVSRAVFWSALKLARSMRRKLSLMRDENNRLRQRIEDIRIVDRAKCMLISREGISEQEAHRRIEKQAMDMRATKRAVAEKILTEFGA